MARTRTRVFMRRHSFAKGETESYCITSVYHQQTQLKRTRYCHRSGESRGFCAKTTEIGVETRSRPEIRTGIDSGQKAVPAGRSRSRTAVPSARNPRRSG